MATSDSELIDEVRSLTSYGTDIISNSDFTNLVAVAKEEILEAVDESSLDWYNNRAAERALFWLVSLFAKVHTGEVGGSAFTIGELEQAPMLGTNAFWLNRFHDHLYNIGEQPMYGHRSVSRDDRTYG